MTTGSFPHDNFSSIYWIFTTLGHQIPLWKGKNPIYFGVISSKIKVTVTMEHFISIEPLLRGHLSYKATFSLFQRWPLNTGLTIYLKYILNFNIQYVGFNNVPHEIMSTGYFFIVNIAYGQYLLILMCPGHNLPMK